MSYDRIWLCPSLKRVDWVEVYSRSRRLISNDESFSEESIEKELQKYGKFDVSLSMGENCLIDHLFRFLNYSDARRFIAGEPLEVGEQGYRSREYIKEGAGPDGYDIGIGFDRVEFYIHGELVEKKQVSNRWDYAANGLKEAHVQHAKSARR